MVSIEFKYCFKDKNETHEITNCLKDEILHDYDVCEMFCEFMRSAGFSEENILKYFRE